MKLWKKVFALLTTTMLTLTFAMQAFAADGTWVQNSTGWWYQNADGTWPANEWLLDNDFKWYHFDENGYMQTGRHIIGNYTYEFSTSGNMIANNVTKTDVITEFEDAVNARRTAAGLAPYNVDDRLMAAAQTRANEITTKFGHKRPNDLTYGTVFYENGYTPSASDEILLGGDNAPSAVVSVWMNSAFNKGEILSTTYEDMGVATTTVDGRTFWVLVVAKEK